MLLKLTQKIAKWVALCLESLHLYFAKVDTVWDRLALSEIVAYVQLLGIPNGAADVGLYQRPRSAVQYHNHYTTGKPSQER